MKKNNDAVDCKKQIINIHNLRHLKHVLYNLKKKSNNNNIFQGNDNRIQIKKLCNS